MANIEVKIEAEKNLTVFTVEGDMTSEEIIQYSTEYYNEKPKHYYFISPVAREC